MQENKFRVEVSGLNAFGLGVTKIADLVVFVEGALPGEVAEIKITERKKNFALAKIISLEKMVPERISPECPHFLKCGSCHLLHFAYLAELKYKENRVRQCVQRIGKVDDFHLDATLACASPLYYRNKVKMSFASLNKKIVCGYYQRGTHDVIPIRTCLLIPPLALKIIHEVTDIANREQISVYNEEKRTGLLRHIVLRTNGKGDVMVVLVASDFLASFGVKIIKALKASFPQIRSLWENINKSPGNQLFGEEDQLLWGKEKIQEKIADLTFSLSYRSFFQINLPQAERLYQTVKNCVLETKSRIIADLYCGIGAMTLFLARSVDFIYGIEIDPASVEDAQASALLNHITNVEFILGDVQDLFSRVIEKGVDLAILDPPRKGLSPLTCALINNSGLKNIIYVSCDPATFARDLAELNSCYQIVSCRIIDMFPRTCGIEVVAHLKRNKET